MALYEYTFIVRQDIPAAQVKSLADYFKAVIEEKNGSVPKIEYCGLRSLAYRIRKNRKGHYVLMNIDAPAMAIHELERQMRLHEDILRFLTISVDVLDPNPSCLAQSRSGRGERQEDDRVPSLSDDEPEFSAQLQEASI